MQNNQNTLNQMPVQYLKGVGPRLAELLAKCHIKTTQDIIFHLPFRYQDRTKITPIREAKVGEWIVIEGLIIGVENKRRLICQLSDQTGVINLLFFNITFLQKSIYTHGAHLRCYGEVKHSTFGLTLIHPECQIISDNTDTVSPPDNTLTPVYPSTAGLSQALWQKITYEALILIHQRTLPDYLENKFIPSVDIKITLHEAIFYIHRPPKDADIGQLSENTHPAQIRLAIEELLAHHLSLKIRRQKIKQQSAPIFRYSVSEKFIKKFMDELAFTLTNAQKKVISEISQDLSQPHPMLRLMQGDVGSGKTVVAAISALQAISNHAQVAFMAPTELLSEQHYFNFKNWFANFDVRVLLLNGKLKLSEKNFIIEQLKNDPDLIIIGTHALFQEKIAFKNLGLIIIDEQHRFGVEQRLALKQKGNCPHQLMLTATPIPRTLAMTFYADLNVSIIDELPPGRTPIKTVIINQSRRHEVIQRIEQAHHEKRQIYWVCTLIAESEQLQCQAAEATEKSLKQLLPALNIALIHGKLKNVEKEKIMQDFKQGYIDLLVATTVIEVGIDVANASVMIIENAERLGLSQLHQLRGRVGRGDTESYCLLLYQPPLSLDAQERLKIMRAQQDGFKIAEKDLELRGPGDFLGTRQTGLLNLRAADLKRDQYLFETVQKIADDLIKHSPASIPPLIERWLGQTEEFQGV